MKNKFELVITRAEILIFSCVSLASCTFKEAPSEQASKNVVLHQSTTLANSKPVNPVTEPPVSLPGSSTIDQERCPTKADVRLSFKQAEDIIHRGKSLLKKLTNSTVKNSELKALRDWRDEEKRWIVNDNQLIDWCELLLGANGTEVYPEYKPTLQHLKTGVIWLEKSIDFKLRKKLVESAAYMRGSTKALRQAKLVLNKKIKPNSKLRIPNAIKNIEAVPSATSAN